MVAVDGTDFKVNEPSPFSWKWCSHKINHAGLRYEVGICIQTGSIVWINGPYAPGHWPDINIARDCLHGALDSDELHLADGAHKDGHGWCVVPNGLNNADQHMKAVARARHEVINGLFKQFGCLSHTFRHHRTKHGLAFTAVANIAQAKILLEDPPFQVVYDDNSIV